METEQNPPQINAEKISLLDRPWLHWGVIVAGLYLLMLVALTLPFLWACFPKGWNENFRAQLEVYETWQYWILIGILALSQFLLLRVPVRLKTRRPVRRSAVWLPVVVSGFWMGGLVLGLGVTLMELCKIDSPVYPWMLLAVVLASWFLWTVVFLLMARSKEPQATAKQQTGWLLKGSILELLVAVPSHIVARGRTDCCAGLFTFFGITMGASVMLLSFGPAVFVLYYARWQRLKKAP